MDGGGAKQGKCRWFLLAVAACLFFGAELCAQDVNSDSEGIRVRISDDPNDAIVQVREGDKTILTETRGGDGNVDHTVTMQDFEKGLQAVKDLDRRKCFIFATSESFDSIKDIAEGNEQPRTPDIKTDMDKKAVRCPIPAEFIKLALGDKIGSFCEDVDSHWLTEPYSVSELKGLKTKRFGTRRTKRGWFGPYFRIGW